MIQVTVPSKAYVLRGSIVGIAASNPAEVMDVRLLFLLGATADHSFRGVLPVV